MKNKFHKYIKEKEFKKGTYIFLVISLLFLIISMLFLLLLTSCSTTQKIFRNQQTGWVATNKGDTIIFSLPQNTTIEYQNTKVSTDKKKGVFSILLSPVTKLLEIFKIDDLFNNK